MGAIIGFRHIVLAAVAAMSAVAFGVDGVGATTGKIPAVNWIADGSGKLLQMDHAYIFADGGTSDFIEKDANTHYVFDFGTCRKISAVKVWPRSGAFGSRAKPFKVRGSNDNQTWTELYANEKEIADNTPLEVSLDVAERYRYVDFYNFTSGNMSELAVYSGELMLDMNAADPWQQASVDAEDSANGVKISGTLVNPPAEGEVSVEVFAAREDFGDDYAAWVGGGATKITLESGENNAYAGFFTGLDEGRWYWRAFAVHGSAKIPSGTTWPFAVDTVAVHPKAYASSADLKIHYNGVTGGHEGDKSGTMIFDLGDTYESTKGYHLESMRIFLRGDQQPLTFFDGYTAVSYALGYETPGGTVYWNEGSSSSTDTSGKRTLVNYTSPPTGFDWSETFYSILLSVYKKLPVTVVFPVETTTRKPRCVKVACGGTFRFVEVEFRYAKDPAAEVTLEVTGEPAKVGRPDPDYGEYGLSASVEKVASVTETIYRNPDDTYEYTLAGWRLTVVNSAGTKTNVTENTAANVTACAFTPASGDRVTLAWKWSAAKRPTRIPVQYAVYANGTTLDVAGRTSRLLFDGNITSTSQNDVLLGKPTIVLDLGTPHHVDEIGVAPRPTFGARLRNIKAAGSDDGMTWDEPFYVNSDIIPPDNVITKLPAKSEKKYRFVKLYDFEDIHEVYVYTDDLAVETWPADPWAGNAVASEDSADGVKVMLKLANGRGAPAHLVAYAAQEDLGEEHEAWRTKGVAAEMTEESAEGTPENRMATGFFRNLRRGRWYWRAFAVQDGVVGSCDRTWPFTVGTEAIHPKCYSNGTLHYDGVVGWTNDDGNDYVFDLRSIPSGWHLDSVRLWKRDGFYRRLVSHELTLGYATGDEEVSFNGTGVIKSAEGAVRVIEGFGGLADMTGVEWRPGEPLLLSAPYDKVPTVYSFPIAKPSAAKPVALKFVGIGGDYNSLGEIELRIARDEVKGLMIRIQ